MRRHACLHCRLPIRAVYGFCPACVAHQQYLQRSARVPIPGWGAYTRTALVTKKLAVLADAMLEEQVRDAREDQPGG